MELATFEGARTKPPRHYETSGYCILKTTMLLRDGYDLFLTSNGVVLCYDDIPCRYFEIVGEFPYLGYHFANRTTGHGLPPEIKIGTWRHNMTVREKYEEYLPSGEISQYLENDQIVEWRVPHSPFPKRRTQRGNSWAKKFLRGTWSCSTTFQMTEENQKLVMICRMDYKLTNKVR